MTRPVRSGSRRIDQTGYHDSCIRAGFKPAAQRRSPHDLCNAGVYVAESACDLDCDLCCPDRVPDECNEVPDCNGNSIPDLCELRCDVPGGFCDPYQGNCGIATDCNNNCVLDECEIDVNSTAPGGPFFCDPSSPPIGLEQCDPDCNNNGIPDECEELVVDAPTAASGVAGYEKNRYISFVPGNAGEYTALRVTLTDLPVPFEDHEGETLWVGPWDPMTEVAGSIDNTLEPTFAGALLQAEPHYWDWFDVCGVLHVFDPAIVPSATYAVQAIQKERTCPGELLNEDYFSEALELTTSLWGDVAGNCPPMPATCTPPDGVADFKDIEAMVNKFTNHPGSPIKARADLSIDLPDRVIDYIDISDAVDAFKGKPYPYNGP